MAKGNLEVGAKYYMQVGEQVGDGLVIHSKWDHCLGATTWNGKILWREVCGGGGQSWELQVTDTCTQLYEITARKCLVGKGDSMGALYLYDCDARDDFQCWSFKPNQRSSMLDFYLVNAIGECLSQKFSGSRNYKTRSISLTNCADVRFLNNREYSIVSR